MRILLTNDDGIYAPGLAAMEQELSRFADVTVIAPATEQSGVGHSVTFLTPLVCKAIFDHDRQRGWAVEGSPADCVRIGIFEFFEEEPDLIISGINHGLNAGINVLYSGTVAAAVEAAFFGITSFAVSLEYDEHADFDKAAAISGTIIRQVIERPESHGQLFNLNIPTAATAAPQPPKIVPMGVARYGEHYLKREDPRGRTYFWATNDPPPRLDGEENDLTVVSSGGISLTPLQFNMTKDSMLQIMQQWPTLSVEPACEPNPEPKVQK